MGGKWRKGAGSPQVKWPVKVELRELPVRAAAGPWSCQLSHSSGVVSEKPLSKGERLTLTEKLLGPKTKLQGRNNGDRAKEQTHRKGKGASRLQRKQVTEH